ncbi:DUF4258 domain-containing protein, partial [Listeria goaensis]|uniref:DUF4258 domain-containing protein n=1 Tax=Listeria goaensis TaxID=1649188 RepID=UPI0013C2A131
KDGVRVPNSELEAYLKRTADYQDEDKYTILTLEELNEKIMKAWQDKTYYMDGKVYSGAAGSILQASAYVEDWEGQLAESGIMSALSGVGLGAAIARGSKTYKGGSGATAKIGESFGKSGTLVKNPGTKIDWSKVTDHGLKRMDERGVTKKNVESWVKNGKALEQAGGNKHLFFTKEGAVVVAKDGTLVTAIPVSKYDNAYKELSLKLFGD